jgi:hypothetical protein
LATKSETSTIHCTRHDRDQIRGPPNAVHEKGFGRQGAIRCRLPEVKSYLAAFSSSHRQVKPCGPADALRRQIHHAHPTIVLVG